jgi:hypothetical protein
MERGLTLQGHAFWYGRLIMPAVDPKIIQSVIYLYPDVDSAQRADPIGGTGFIVAVHFSDGRESPYFLYAVTNSHVVREGRSPIVRVNTRTGPADVLPLGFDSWVHHPDGDDVAVAKIGLSPEHHQIGAISTKIFLGKEECATLCVAPGDDVFFVGRFAEHDGGYVNVPTVRSGNIAMMPDIPIRHKTRGIDVESYLVEGRSLSGYSGSPVFLQIYPLIPRPGIGPGQLGAGPFLLGIDWCHLARFQPVLESDQETPIAEKWYVEQNSGMMGVVPAWKILETLNQEALVKSRKVTEAAWLQEHERKSNGVGLDSAQTDETAFGR